VQFQQPGFVDGVAEALRAVPILDEHTPGLVAALERDWVVLAHADDGSIARPLWDAYGTRRGVFIALLHGSTLVGAQVAALRSDDVVFGPRHVRIAQGIAQLASLAIANARLVGELEAASRIKSDFVATMSHELRTPLNVILGYAEMLSDLDRDCTSSVSLPLVRRIRGSAAGLLELVNATLDLARLEAGRDVVFETPVDLEGLFAELADEIEPLQTKSHTSVRWRDAVGPTLVMADRTKLKTILKNLVGNALKYTPEGTVEISAGLAGEQLEIAVRDSGVGIAAENLPAIFEMFRQVENVSTHPFGGVGLGLYIVKQLAERLQGSVAVESTVGVGSTFTVRIPTRVAPTIELEERRLAAG